MHTIAVLSRKGGTGKTTITVNLAIGAFRRGVRVMVADVDPQHSAGYALGSRVDAGPSCIETTAGKLFALKMAATKQDIDLLLIDTPGALDAAVLQSIHLADSCLIVTRPSYLDLAGAMATAETVRQLSKPAMVVLNQVPPSRNGVEASLVRRAREAARFTGFPVAGTALHARSIYSSAIASGRSGEEVDPQGPAADEIDRLWRDLEASLTQPIPRRASV